MNDIHVIPTLLMHSRNFECKLYILVVYSVLKSHLVFSPPSICIWLERWHILTSFLWSLWCVSVVTVLFGDSFPSAVSFIIFSFQIGYKLYSRHVAKNLHFDNPVFEQKPLRTSVRQADSRAWDDARRNVRFNCLASMRSFWFVHCVVVLEVIR